MRKTKCAIPECKQKSTRPMCDHHIQQLTPEMANALLLAHRKLKAGRADGLRIFSNTLRSAKLQLERKVADQPPTPVQESLL